MTAPLRVALFTDCFREANGVATVSRQFAAFAQRRKLPFVCVHSGPKTTALREDACFTTLELQRSIASFPLDHDLDCDPLLTRHRDWVLSQLRPFQPDLVHITSPSDVGILGLWVAHLLHVPLVASWHTNLHEYAGRRLDKLFSFLPARWRRSVSGGAEQQSLRALVRFYRIARFLFAPNQSMVDLLEQRTGKPTFLMEHGVDTQAFSPGRRSKRPGVFSIGYVGRLTPEKNVRMLASIEEALRAAGRRDFRIIVVGDGSEKEWLRRNLQFGDVRGILRGEPLSDAFAEMDAFVFPSRTDTFGLVLLEAMASGTPVIVSGETGVRVGIRHGETGFFAEDVAGCAESILKLMDSEGMRCQLGCAARAFACSRGWDGVFDQLYESYKVGLRTLKQKATS